MEQKITLTAHRGYRQKYPENTMRAFREALKLDIDSIETDVRMTADGEIVVIHDATLDRTTDKKGHICDLTLEEIRKADAGIRFGEEFRGEQVPTLDELLALLATRPDVRLLLELKDYPEEYGDFAYVSLEKTFDLCKKYGVWGKDRITVITFSAGLCAWIRKKHRDEEILIHGFYPKSVMKGAEKEDPYPYLNEVCIFSRTNGVPGGSATWGGTSPVVDKKIFDQFLAMHIRPCVYFSWNTNEEDYRKALENGATGFTCDDAYTCGKILDKLGARKLK